LVIGIECRGNDRELRCVAEPVLHTYQCRLPSDMNKLQHARAAMTCTPTYACALADFVHGKADSHVDTCVAPAFACFVVASR